ASGRAGSKAHVDLYRATGLSEIPTRGPLAANTVAGAVSGWARALELSADWRTPTPLEALLEPAIAFAEAGSITPEGMAEVLADKAKELGAVDGFAQTFLAGGVPASGTVLRQPALGRTLRRLARHGLDDFYRGGVARDLAADLEA